MTWTIKAKTPFFREGDSGKTGTKFEIKWTGDKFPIDGGGWVHVQLKKFNVTTDIGDQIQIEEALRGEIVKIYFEPSKDAYGKLNKVEISKTITVTTLADERPEGNEVFGIEIMSADWYDGPHDNSKLIPTNEEIDAVDYAVVVDDDSAGWSQQTRDTVIRQIREDGENGTIDETQSEEIIGALTEKGKTAKIVDGTPAKDKIKKTAYSGEQYSELETSDSFDFQILAPTVSKDAVFTGLETLSLGGDLFETEQESTPLASDLEPHLSFVDIPTLSDSLLLDFG